MSFWMCSFSEANSDFKDISLDQQQSLPWFGQCSGGSGYLLPSSPSSMSTSSLRKHPPCQIWSSARPKFFYSSESTSWTGVSWFSFILLNRSISHAHSRLVSFLVTSQQDWHQGDNKGKWSTVRVRVGDLECLCLQVVLQYLEALVWHPQYQESC